MTQIKAKDLKHGDTVELESGLFATIKSIANGFYRNSKLLQFSNGLWSCVLNNER